MTKPIFHPSDSCSRMRRKFTISRYERIKLWRTSAVFTEALERNRENAWQILRDTLRWLVSVLIVITLAGEAVLDVWVWLVHDDPHVRLLAGLTAVFLPYLIVVCVTAVAAESLSG